MMSMSIEYDDDDEYDMHLIILCLINIHFSI